MHAHNKGGCNWHAARGKEAKKLGLQEEGEVVNDPLPMNELIVVTAINSVTNTVVIVKVDGNNGKLVLCSVNRLIDKNN